MTTTNPPSPAAPTGARHPLAAHRPQRPGSGPAIAAALSRSSLTAFVREPVAFIMTIFYPLLMLLIFGAVFRNDVVPGVSYADYMLPAMISTGTIMSCLLTLAIGVASERESGELKRLAVLPVPTWAYVASKCVYNTILAVVSAVLLLLVGLTAGRWSRLGAVRGRTRSHGRRLHPVGAGRGAPVAFSRCRFWRAAAGGYGLPVRLRPPPAPVHAAVLDGPRLLGLPGALVGGAHATGIPPRLLRLH